MSEFCTDDDWARWQAQWAADGLGSRSEGDIDLILRVKFGSQPEVCRRCHTRPATLWVGWRGSGQNLTETRCVHCLIDGEDARIGIGSAWNGTTWSRAAIDVLARDHLTAEFARMHPASTIADPLTVELLWTRCAPDDPAAPSERRWSGGLVSRLRRLRDLLEAARVG